MSSSDWLAKQFEENRSHLRAVAYRMLGSVSEADDAVQEAWLRLSRSDANSIENLGGWLTTVTARVCLDILRSRTSRREESLEAQVIEPTPQQQGSPDPEQEAQMAESVGLALLVVLDRLTPAERLAFVLHDIFSISFDEISTIVGRSADATRQLASRARRRVQGATVEPDVDRVQQREIASSFLDALRRGDVEGLVAVLDPDVVVRIDHAAGRPDGPPLEIHGARKWAQQAVAFTRFARFVQLALIDGRVALILAPGGRLSSVLQFTATNGKIVGVDIVSEPARLRDLDLRILE
jgi:RNA polymerase sigma-70 factor (ECF subfamily)